MKTEVVVATISVVGIVASSIIGFYAGRNRIPKIAVPPGESQIIYQGSPMQSKYRIFNQGPNSVQVIAIPGGGVEFMPVILSGSFVDVAGIDIRVQIAPGKSGSSPSIVEVELLELGVVLGNP